MKKVKISLLSLLASVLLAGMAYADSVFPVHVNVSNYYTNGVAYYEDTDENSPTYGDFLGGSQVMEPGIYMGPDGIVDSNSVGRFSEWYNSLTGEYIYNIYDSAFDDQEITLVVSGIDDVMILPVSWNSSGVVQELQLFSTGLQVDIYMDDTPDFSTQTGSGAYAPGDVLLLSLVGHTQVGTDDAGVDFEYNLEETYDIGENEYTGTALFDVVGGSWADIYDTNTISALYSATGENADFSFSFSISDNTDPLVPIGWELAGTGNGVGAAVPEPTTIFLFGVGLIGLAGIGRSRREV